MSLHRRVAARTVLALSVALAGPSSLAAQLGEISRDTVLANGLEVIVIPNHSIPVATLEVVVRAGAFTQIEPADEGVPHMLEHMLFKAYERDGFGAEASELEASYNGTTGQERVTYYLTLPSSNVQRGLELLGDLVRQPEFDAEGMIEERRVVRGELERNGSDPFWIMNIVADRALWGAAFQRKNAIGNALTIEGAGPDRLLQHYSKYYVPNNAALIASGDVEPDSVFGWAAESFGAWERADDPFANFEALRVEPLESDTAFVVDMASPDVTLMIKWHGPSAHDDPMGSAAATLFEEMFNQTTSSAQRRLVDSGVFQGVSVGYETLRNVGPVEMMARTTPARLGGALSAIGMELALMGDPSYFSDAELASAKKSFRVGAAIGRENGPGSAHARADRWAVLGGARDPEAVSVQDVGLGDVRAFMERYLIGRPKVVAVLVPEQLMRPLGPVIGGVVAQWPGAR